jgi:hypothetical protein
LFAELLNGKIQLGQWEVVFEIKLALLLGFTEILDVLLRLSLCWAGEDYGCPVIFGQGKIMDVQ